MTENVTQPLHFCSYFDHRYLARALCLYDSLVNHSPPFQWHVLALSETCSSILQQLNLPFIEVTKLSDLEQALPELLSAKSNRSTVEYYFTLTSAFCRHLIDQVHSGELLTYLDSDLYFFDSPQPVIDELSEASIGIIEHRFSEGIKEKIKYGRFNVGWVSFRNDELGKECLEDWSAKCLDWCYDRLEDDRFADQKYLDRWPIDFLGVHVIEHRGANVGPWNISDFPLSPEIKPERSPVASDGTPLLFAHFQFVRRLGFRTYETGLDAYHVNPNMRKLIVEQVYKPYLKHLQQSEGFIATYQAKFELEDRSSLRHDSKLLDGLRPLQVLGFPLKYLSKLREYCWVRV